MSATRITKRNHQKRRAQLLDRLAKELLDQPSVLAELDKLAPALSRHTGSLASFLDKEGMLDDLHIAVRLRLGASLGAE